MGCGYYRVLARTRFARFLARFLSVVEHVFYRGTCKVSLRSPCVPLRRSGICLGDKFFTARTSFAPPLPEPRLRQPAGDAVSVRGRACFLSGYLQGLASLALRTPSSKRHMPGGQVFYGANFVRSATSRTPLTPASWRRGFCPWSSMFFIGVLARSRFARLAYPFVEAAYAWGTSFLRRELRSLRHFQNPAYAS